MIRIPEPLAQRIRGHAAEAYPEECCGVLVGSDADEGEGDRTERRGAREIREIRAVENARTGRRERRYLIPPEVLLELEKELREGNLEVLGFYHSHPDHPAEPSAFDREHAWPWYSYVIVPVREGEAAEPRSWRLAPDRSRFDEEAIERI